MKGREFVDLFEKILQRGFSQRKVNIHRTDTHREGVDGLRQWLALEVQTLYKGTKIFKYALDMHAIGGRDNVLPLTPESYKPVD